MNFLLSMIRLFFITFESIKYFFIDAPQYRAYHIIEVQNMAFSQSEKVTIEKLNKGYLDLLNDVTHGPGCFCASCLYQYRMRGIEGEKKRWLDKESFFLYWLVYEHSENKEKFTRPYSRAPLDNWEEIKKLFYEITKSKKIDKFTWPDLEHYRILSKYKKKANIFYLTMNKDATEALLFMHFASFMLEAEKILKSMKKYNSNITAQDTRFLSNEELELIYQFIRKAFQIFFYIANECLEKNEGIKQRDVSRRFKIKKQGLLIILDYLKKRNLIIWNDNENRIILHGNWKDSHRFFFHVLDTIHNGFKEAARIFLVDFTLKPIKIEMHETLRKTLRKD